MQDAPIDFGFASLPDPDDLWNDLLACQETVCLLDTIIKSYIDLKLAKARNNLNELDITASDSIKDDMLNLFTTTEELEQRVVSDIDSELWRQRGMATGIGIDLDSPQSSSGPFQTAAIQTQQQSDTARLFNTGSPTVRAPLSPIGGVRQWYCLRSPVGTVTCASATIGHLKQLLLSGWTQYGGPYGSFSECFSRCNNVRASQGQSRAALPIAFDEPQPTASSIGCVIDEFGNQVCDGTGTEPTIPPVPIPTEPIPTEPIPPTPPTEPTEPPIPTPECFNWYCLRSADGTQHACTCAANDTALQLFTDAGWTVLSGPYASQDICIQFCAAVIDVPPPPPPPIDGDTRYWCVFPPGMLTRICLATTQTREDLIAAGYTITSGPYSTDQECRATCGFVVIPNQHFWCVENNTTRQWFCLAAVTVLGQDGNIVPPTSTLWTVKKGPYRTQSECTAQCVKPPPPPPPPVPPFEPPPPVIRWWCVCTADRHSYCISNSTVDPVEPTVPAGDKVCGGPWITQEECLSHCQTQPPPPPIDYYCICNTDDTERRCWPSDIVPPPGWELCMGPFLNIEECQQLCKVPVPQPKPAWWCRLPRTGGDMYCWLGVQGTRPSDAVGPWHATLAECEQACKRQPPPPEPTPPPTTPPEPTPPIPYPVPTPTPGPPAVCCPPPPQEEELHKWRCWTDCNGNKYITGPGQPPHSSSDHLDGEFDSVSSAQSACGGEFCPKPPEKPKPAEQDSIGSNQDWGKLDVCDTIDNSVIQVPKSADCTLAKLLGIVSDSGGPPVLVSGFGPTDLVVNAVANLLFSAGKQIICSVEKWIRSAGGRDACNNDTQTGLDLAYAVNTWAERIGGVNNERFKIPINYTQNYLCPHIIPSPDNAIRSFLTNDISEDLLRCWTQANGLYWEPTTKVVKSLRTRHSAQDLTRLWLRGILSDVQHTDRVRELGYLYGSDVSELRELSKLFPPYSDIIRLMVRDAADESIPDWPESDKLWAEKYTGELQKWGKYAGLPDEVTKLLWRAHWSIPAPTQLYTIWQRERQRGDAIEATALGQSIRQALQQQDILPRWIPHLLNSAYRLLGRVDIRRAYQIGVLDRAGVDAALIKTGYDDESANTLTEFTVRNARLSLRVHSAVRSYLSFGLSRAQASAELRDYGATDADIEWVLNWAIGRMRAKSRETCSKGIRKQFTTGALDLEETRAALMGLGLDAEQVDIALTTWQCELHNRGKMPSASVLCRWLHDGLIDGLEMFDRLTTLGWERGDASNLVASCERAKAIKLAREELKRRKEQMAEAKRIEKEKERAQKELQKQLDQRARALAAAQAKKEQREKAMLKAADKLSDTCSISAEMAMLLVRQAVANNRDTFGLTLTESITAVVEAADDYDESNCGGFLSHARDYGSAMSAAEPSDNPIDQNR